MIDSTIGLDSGPMTGMAFLDYESERLVGRTLLQCDGGSAPVVLKGMLIAYYCADTTGVPELGKRVGSVERFVTGPSAGSRGKAADVTRQLVMELAEVLQLFGYAVKIRPAADVKPWASDKRLTAAQVMPKTATTTHKNEYRHAYDAARHCLYGAREAGVIPDPLLHGRSVTGTALQARPA